MISSLLQNILPAKTYNAAKTLTLTAGVAGLGMIMVLLTGYVMASPTFGWTGTLMPCPLHPMTVATLCPLAVSCASLLNCCVLPSLERHSACM